MTMTTIDVTTIAPLTHDEAMRLQAQELGHCSRCSGSSTTARGRRRLTAQPGTSVRCANTSWAHAMRAHRCARTSTRCAWPGPTASGTAAHSKRLCRPCRWVSVPT